MFFGPTDLARYNCISPITSSTYVDPDGTCRIYHGPPELPESSFKDNFILFGKMTEIRTVNLHYNLQPDSFHERFEYPSLPSMSNFKRSCPVWHFVDAAIEGPKPRCNIIVSYHGTGELPYGYDVMLSHLLCLMESLTLSGFENVTVKIVPGLLYDGNKCPLPSETAMNLLRHQIENSMGVAEVSYAGEECRMEFCPSHLAEMWSKQPQGGEAAWARSRAARMRHQRRAKRGLRNLLKI